MSKPHYWAVIPATVRYDTELPPNAKLLYGEVSALTDIAGYCFASNSYFEELFNLSERTVSRLLKALEQSGYIKIVDADGGKSQRKIYAGINPLAPPDKNVYTPPTKMSIPPDKNVCHTKESNNIPPIVPQRDGGSAEESGAEPKWKPDVFSRFWKLYPIHKSKRAAIRAWDKLKPSDELLAEMSAALKRQVKSEEWKRGIGIPYPSTYLNQRRWEDEDDSNTAAADAPADQAGGGELPWI